MDILIFVIFHGVENNLLFCHIVIHKKKIWRKLQCDDEFVYKSVRKFREQYYVCCFTFQWRRMVRAMKRGRNATTKGKTRFEAKHFSWFSVFFVLYNLHSNWLRHFHL
jgi:hypothetical protein